MSWFLLIALVIYASAQTYIFIDIRRGLRLRRWAQVCLGLWLGGMVGGPMLVGWLDRREWTGLADGVALVVYTWMAVTFWLVLCFFLTDVWNLLIRVFKRFSRRLRAGRIPGPWRVGVTLVLVALATAWGLREATTLEVRHVEFQADLPPGREQVRIVQISDLHLGLHVRRKGLEHVVGRIEALEPDLIVSTGDVVDASHERVAPLVGLLARLDAPLGKYAIFGNHEFYAGTGVSAEFHEKAGFRLLRQEALEVLPGLWLAGLDDTVGSRRGFRPLTDQNKALSGVDPNGYVILLKHRPDIEGVGTFHLQLSGHTHGGQIWPWHYITALQFPFVAGTHDLGRGSWVHVNRGTGTWGPQVRLFARPEITLITLVARR